MLRNALPSDRHTWCLSPDLITVIRSADRAGVDLGNIICSW